MNDNEKVMPMPKEQTGFVQMVRELNAALNDPQALDEALKRVQDAMEKGAIPEPIKPDNA